MPALIDWFPDEAARSPWDINGNLAIGSSWDGKPGIEEQEQAVWNAGYPCALLPSDFIDNGRITFDAENHPVIDGHQFDCMIFLNPQYAKETTLQFLERFTQSGGKLMLEGNATRDFDGNDIASCFEKIAARATVRGFDVNQISKLGAQTNSLPNGAFMEDGSVIFSDIQSWQKNRAKPFSIELAGHKFSGSYIGVCALKVNDSGDIEKFACGGFSKLSRDGQVVFSLESPADIVVNQTANGEYNATIVSSTTNHFREY